MNSIINEEKKKAQKEYNSKFKKLNCRMFEEVYPKRNKIVSCKVTQIQRGKVIVSLLEYDKISGILFSKELSTYKTRFPRRILNVGKELVLKVIYVNPNEKKIVLSRIKVTPEETIKQREKYKKLLKINGIIKLLSVKMNLPMLYLYEKIIWPLYHKNICPFDAFSMIAMGSKKYFKYLNLEENLKNELIKIVKIRMAPKLVEIRSEFKLVNYSFEGIDAIKEALLEGKKIGTKDYPIIYRTLGSPLYECTLKTYNKTNGINIMKKSLNVVKDLIIEKGGNYLLCQEPYIIKLKKNKF